MPGVFYLFVGFLIGAVAALIGVRRLLMGRVIHYTVDDEQAVYLELNKDISHLLKRRYALFEVSPRK